MGCWRHPQTTRSPTHKTDLSAGFGRRHPLQKAAVVSPESRMEATRAAICAEESRIWARDDCQPLTFGSSRCCREGGGRTDTVERSPGQGAEVVCSEHTTELVWSHLNGVGHKCEIRCRLTRGRCQTPDPCYPPKPARIPNTPLK
jgi:hypothetical protein